MIIRHHGPSMPIGSKPHAISASSWDFFEPDQADEARRVYQRERLQRLRDEAAPMPFDEWSARRAWRKLFA